MQYDVEIDGRTWHIVVVRGEDGYTVTMGGRTCRVDAARIDAQTLSLLVGPGAPGADAAPGGDVNALARVASPFSRTGPRAAYDVMIVPDIRSGQLTVHVGATPFAVALDGRRRSARRDDAQHASTGPQRIVAPMSGKIVRVGVKPGETVRARQPLVVVEAMKMENELRAGRDGTVVELHAKVRMSVDAGALLILIQ